MYLAISALGMSVTALLANRLGVEKLGYIGLALAAVTSGVLFSLVSFGIWHEYF